MVLLNFFGSLPLAAAILFAFVLAFARALILLNFLSSQDSLYVFGVPVDEVAQVSVATFALVGPPAGILAGFGVLFRMERYVRTFAYHQAITNVVDIIFAIVVVVHGDICQALAHQILLQNGPLFICAVVNLGVCFWLIVLCAFEGYVAYAVWSQAEALQKGEYAELLRYQHTVPHL